MSHTSADEHLVNCRQRLGDEYGRAFHHGLQEFWQLSSTWDQHESLFESRAKVDLLNKSGGQFWHTVQDMLFERVMLGLCRLTDRPRMHGKRCLTVRLLFDLDKSSGRSDLESLVITAEQATSFARRWRNTRIAHNDYDVKTGEAAPLPAATRRSVTDALDEIHEVFRWIDSEHCDTDLRLMQIGDHAAFEILETVYHGVAAQKVRQEQFLAGNYSQLAARAPGWLFRSDVTKSRYRWGVG